MTAINTATTAVIARLSAAPAVSATIDRVRLRPLAKTIADAVVVTPTRATAMDPPRLAGLPMAWEVEVLVQCLARVAGSSPDVAVDSLLSSAYARLMADQTLGGYVSHFEPVRVDYAYEAADENFVCATLLATVRVVTESATI